MNRFLVSATTAALILMATAAAAQDKPQQTLSPETAVTDAQIERVLEEANRARKNQQVEQTVTTKQENAKEDQVQALPASSKQDSTHIVKKGDTLYSLSKKYGLKIEEIQAANADVSGNAIKIGQSLNIPLKTKSLSLGSSTKNAVLAENKVTTSGSSMKRVVLPVTAETNTIYAVLPKDTLYSISKRSCVEVKDLVSVNGISKPNALKPGKKLILPEGHCLNR